jgi:hypothetical protein
VQVSVVVGVVAVIGGAELTPVGGGSTGQTSMPWKLLPTGIGITEPRGSQ